MKPSLQFRLSQHLTLTPQLQQSIRLLQLSTVELNQEIDRLLMENPALEREDVEESGEAPPAASGSSSTATEAAPTTDSDWARELSRPAAPAAPRARGRRRALAERVPRAPAAQPRRLRRAQACARDRGDAPRAPRRARLHAAEGAHRRGRRGPAFGAAPDPRPQ